MTRQITMRGSRWHGWRRMRIVQIGMTDRMPSRIVCERYMSGRLRMSRRRRRRGMFR